MATINYSRKQPVLSEDGTPLYHAVKVDIPGDNVKPFTGSTPDGIPFTLTPTGNGQGEIRFNVPSFDASTLKKYTAKGDKLTISLPQEAFASGKLPYGVTGTVTSNQGTFNSEPVKPKVTAAPAAAPLRTPASRESLKLNEGASTVKGTYRKPEPVAPAAKPATTVITPAPAPKAIPVSANTVNDLTGGDNNNNGGVYYYRSNGTGKVYKTTLKDNIYSKDPAKYTVVTEGDYNKYLTTLNNPANTQPEIKNTGKYYQLAGTPYVYESTTVDDGEYSANSKYNPITKGEYDKYKSLLNNPETNPGDKGGKVLGFFTADTPSLQGIATNAGYSGDYSNLNEMASFLNAKYGNEGQKAFDDYNSQFPKIPVSENTMQDLGGSRQPPVGGFFTKDTKFLENIAMNNGYGGDISDLDGIASFLNSKFGNEGQKYYEDYMKPKVTTGADTLGGGSGADTVNGGALGGGAATTGGAGTPPPPVNTGDPIVTPVSGLTKEDFDKWGAGFNKSLTDWGDKFNTSFTTGMNDWTKNLNNSIMTGVDAKNQKFGVDATNGFMQAFKNFTPYGGGQGGVNLGNYNDDRNAAADQWWSQYITGRR